MQRKCDELSPFSYHEVTVLASLIILILLWFFKSPGFMTGWGDLFLTYNLRGDKVKIGDATPAIFVAILVFVLPAESNFIRAMMKKSGFESSEAVVDWKFVQERMPWGVLLLIGGGFAIAEASKGKLSLLICECSACREGHSKCTGNAGKLHAEKRKQLQYLPLGDSGE